MSGASSVALHALSSADRRDRLSLSSWRQQQNQPPQLDVVDVEPEGGGGQNGDGTGTGTGGKTSGMRKTELSGSPTPRPPNVGEAPKANLKQLPEGPRTRSTCRRR